ncbi:hypothetical protein J6590_006641 [Homalodisca vitripennis]|nr:hypothetical protein J6590_006641 [Homalodisca vitripennis]
MRPAVRYVNPIWPGKARLGERAAGAWLPNSRTCGTHVQRPSAASRPSSVVAAQVSTISRGNKIGVVRIVHYKQPRVSSTKYLLLGLAVTDALVEALNTCRASASCTLDMDSSLPSLHTCYADRGTSDWPRVRKSELETGESTGQAKILPFLPAIWISSGIDASNLENFIEPLVY